MAVTENQPPASTRGGPEPPRRAYPTQHWDLTTNWEVDENDRSKGDRPATDAETHDAVLRIDADQDLRFAIAIGGGEAHAEWASGADMTDVAEVLCACGDRLRDQGHKLLARQVWQAADPVWRLVGGVAA